MAKKTSPAKKSSFGNFIRPKKLHQEGGVRTLAKPNVKKPKGVFGTMKVKKVY